MTAVSSSGRLQFTHIVNLCSAASPTSAFVALSYIFKSSPNIRTSLLYIATRGLVPLLLLSYAFSAVEGVWLHAVAIPTMFPLNNLRSPSQNLRLGRVIDDFCQQKPVYTDCGGEQILPCPLQYLGNSCFDAQGAVDILHGSNEAILTMNNLSTANIIRFTPDTLRHDASRAAFDNIRKRTV